MVKGCPQKRAHIGRAHARPFPMTSELSILAGPHLQEFNFWARRRGQATTAIRSLARLSGTGSCMGVWARGRQPL